MHTPRVSVLIPTYNYGSMLSDAMESVLAQTFTDFEVIIVDNASTDNTEAVVQPYLHDSRVTYHKNETNLGLVGNWNKCLSLARGEYIKFLCADDQFHPQILERFVGVMDTYKTVSLIGCYRTVYGRVSKVLTIPLQHYQKGRDMIRSTINTYHWLGEPSSTMFRKSDIERVGVFDVKKHQFIDLDLWIRLLSVGDCYIVPEQLAMIRSHSEQVTIVSQQTYRFTFEDYELFRDLREGNGYSIDVSDMNIDEAVRKKAVSCARAMYKMIPRLHHKQSRQVFKRAFSIARREQVILAPIMEFIKRKTTSQTLLYLCMVVLNTELISLT